jgi:hypothetical protein
MTGLIAAISVSSVLGVALVAYLVVVLVKRRRRLRYQAVE